MNLVIDLLLGVGVILAVVGLLWVCLRGLVMLAVGSWLCAIAAAMYVTTTGEHWVWLAAIVNSIIAGLATGSVIREVRSE